MSCFNFMRMSPVIEARVAKLNQDSGQTDGGLLLNLTTIHAGGQSNSIYA